MLTLKEFKEARAVLSGVILNTSLVYSKAFSRATGNQVYIKPENMQVTGAYKIRGAYYKISTLSEEEKARGLVTASAGNHAQGVAYAAQAAGVEATIVMPTTTPLVKVNNTKDYGAKVILQGETFDDAAALAAQLSQEQGLTYVHPFNDPAVATGQGTISYEIFQDLPDVDVILVPIGGGGLISGIAFAVKSLRPDCRIVGVQAAGAASMYLSRHAGGPTELRSVSTIADGIAVKKPGDLTFALCQQYVDEIVTVSEDEIASAILALMEVQKTVAEGAGATSVAAVMFGKVDTSSRKTVCLVSGGNVDVTTLSRIITKGLSKAGRIAEITTKVVDKPGSLLQLLKVVADSGANILSIDHSREDQHSDVGACMVSMVLETRDAEGWFSYLCR